MIGMIRLFGLITFLIIQIYCLTSKSDDGVLALPSPIGITFSPTLGPWITTKEIINEIKNKDVNTVKKHEKIIEISKIRAEAKFYLQKRLAEHEANIKKRHDIIEFVRYNKEKLLKEIAQGRGKTLETVINMIECYSFDYSIVLNDLKNNFQLLNSNTINNHFNMSDECFDKMTLNSTENQKSENCNISDFHKNFLGSFYDLAEFYRFYWYFSEKKLGTEYLKKLILDDVQSNDPNIDNEVSNRVAFYDKHYLAANLISYIRFTAKNSRTWAFCRDALSHSNDRMAFVLKYLIDNFDSFYDDKFFPCENKRAVFCIYNTGYLVINESSIDLSHTKEKKLNDLTQRGF